MQWMTRIRTGLFALLGLGLGACASDGTLRLEGVAQNPWSQQDVRFLELTLVGVDGHERYVSEASMTLPDFLLRTNQISPFHLDLRTAGGEVRFDLFYRYRFQDDGRRPFVAGHLAGAPRLLAQMMGFMARDVCSETQHRVPKAGQ